MTDTFNPAPQPPAPGKKPWSTKKKVAAGVGGGFVALWAMGTVSSAVGPDTITETVTETVVSTVTETPAAVTVTETPAAVTETVTITEDAPAPPVVSEPEPEPAPAAVSPAPAPTPRTTYYSSCADVRAAGAAPLHPGDPGYSRKLDRDGDGVACEK